MVLKIVVGISGASGAIYGVRMIETLKKLKIEAHVVISRSAIKTIKHETNYTLKQLKSMSTFFYDPDDIGAKISSGSFLVNGMVIAPCSIKTLSSIANSFNDNLLTRAADVTLKERRKLVILLRETPLHLGHIKLMKSVTEMGGIILPPIPSFYHNPKTVDDIVLHSIGKVLDQFNIDAHLFTRWNGINGE